MSNFRVQERDNRISRILGTLLALETTWHPGVLVLPGQDPDGISSIWLCDFVAAVCGFHAALKASTCGFKFQNQGVSGHQTSRVSHWSWCERVACNDGHREVADSKLPGATPGLLHPCFMLACPSRPQINSEVACRQKVGGLLGSEPPHPTPHLLREM